MVFRKVLTKKLTIMKKLSNLPDNSKLFHFQITANLQRFMNDIPKVQELSLEEESKLIKKAKKGEKKAMDILIGNCYRLLLLIANLYSSEEVKIDDLIGEGIIGAIKAVYRFDNTRGFKFTSYAAKCMQGYILLSIYRDKNLVKIPENFILKFNKINREIEKSFLENGIEMSVMDIANRFDLPIDLIEAFSQYDNRLSRIHSLSEPIARRSNNETLIDYYIKAEDIIESSELADSVVIHQSLKKEISRSLNTLSEREFEFLVLLFGLDRECILKPSKEFLYCYDLLQSQKEKYLSLEEVGEVYGLTSFRVYQIREKALRRLRHPSRSRHLREYLG